MCIPHLEYYGYNFFVVLIQIIKKDECLESGYLHWQSGEVIKEGVMNTSTIKLQEK